jgi:hypothetical protein
VGSLDATAVGSTASYGFHAKIHDILNQNVARLIPTMQSNMGTAVANQMKS